MKISYEHHCFGCGELNPFSLGLKFHQKGDEVYTDFIPEQRHQGYPGLLHGGITSTILDEVMSNSIAAIGLRALTARLEIRFRQSIPIGQKLRAEGRITRKKSRTIDTEGFIYLEDGRLAAEANARFMLMSDELTKDTAD